jgi:hypothetical protein
MSKIILVNLVILTTLFSSCIFIGKPDPNEVEIKILNFGKSSAKLLYDEVDKNMPSGKKSTTDFKLNILETTDTIRIYKGAQFGIEYIIESPEQKLIKLKTVWTYPDKMVNKEGKTFYQTEYFINKLTNEYTYSNYTLENDYEMLEGKWNISLFYDTKELINKNFTLIKK